MSLLKAESKLYPIQANVNRHVLNTRAGLWVAIVTSVIFHLIFIYLWIYDESTVVSMGQPRFSALIVTAETNNTATRKGTASSKPEIAKENRPTAKPASQAIKNVAVTDEKPAKQNDTQLQKQRSVNAVRGNIQSQLSQYLSYPEFARRKGWQGIVIVSLRLNKTGHFKEIQVNSSSGFDILDNTALNAFHNLNAIELTQQFKLAINTRLEIPVQFKLQGS